VKQWKILWTGRCEWCPIELCAPLPVTLFNSMIAADVALIFYFIVYHISLCEIVSFMCAMERSYWGFIKSSKFFIDPMVERIKTIKWIFFYYFLKSFLWFLIWHVISMFRVILQNYREANVSMAAFDLRRTVWNSFRERAHLLSFHHDRSNQSYSITQRTGSNFVHLERADFLSACFLSSILRCKCFKALFDWLIHKTLSSHWSTKRCNIKWIASSVHILYFFEYISVRSSSFYSSLSLPFSGFLPPYYSLSLFCHLLISCLGNHASRIHAAVVARCTYWS